MSRTLLLTGGTGLIGSVQVRHFLERGYVVATTYRDDARLKALGGHGNLVGIKVPDLLASDAAQRIEDMLREKGIFPDCLVNNACDTRWHAMEPDGHVSEECFLNQYRINVVLPYELSWRLVHMKGSRLRKIVNVSSMYGIVPHNPQLYAHPETETPLQYALAKAATIQLTKDLAIRFRDLGVAVNTVSYGGVEGRVDEAFKRRFEPLTPLRRMMKPEETIPAVEFLLEEESHYMTGQNVVVDGGRTVW